MTDTAPPTPGTPRTPRRHRAGRVVAVAVVGLAGAALAGCGSSYGSSAAAPPSGSGSASGPVSLPPSSTTSTSGGAASSATAATTLMSASSSAGRIVVDAHGMTLYRLAPEQGTHIVCTGGCTQNWPPLTVTDAATLTKSQDLPGMLGSVARPDGSVQVTYQGWPLYHFAGDRSPGDVNGQGIAGKWFAVTPTQAP